VDSKVGVGRRHMGVAVARGGQGVVVSQVRRGGREMGQSGRRAEA